MTEVRSLDLKGKTLTAILHKDDVVTFWCASGERYRMEHIQSCCEDVTLEDVTGDWADLLNTPILVAEERCHVKEDTDDVLSMYTFYWFTTINGSVCLRWYGGSNGYYSVSVDFVEVKEDK